MTVTLQDLTLATLRSEIRTEFGGSTSLNTEIDAAINRAISLVWQESKTWRWSLKYLTLTSFGQIQRTTTTAITVSPPTTTVTLSPADLAAVLMRYQLTLPGDPNEYLIAANAAGVAQIVGVGFLTNQNSGVTATLRQAWLELPADFAYMHTLRTESGTTLNKRAIPVEPWVLEMMRKSVIRINSTYSASQFYAILQDPLPYTTTGWQPNRQYISFWPYPTALTKWDGFYYAVPKDLVADADIVEIPRGWRRRLTFIACELLAGKLRDWESQQFYQQKALIGAAQMADANAFADDTGTPLRESTWSYSDLIRNSVVT